MINLGKGIGMEQKEKGSENKTGNIFNSAYFEHVAEMEFVHTKMGCLLNNLMKRVRHYENAILFVDTQQNRILRIPTVKEGKPHA